MHNRNVKEKIRNYERTRKYEHARKRIQLEYNGIVTFIHVSGACD